MNNQKPEPRDYGDGRTIDLHSVFYTIQGEGPFSGHPAVFVRLAGCNLMCPQCDTVYTTGRNRLSLEAVLGRIVNAAPNHRGLVVITGGEPFRQNLDLLLLGLLLSGYSIQIESNGFFEPSEVVYNLAWEKRISIVLSPKTGRINPKIAEIAAAFKYVLDHRSINPEDGLPVEALGHGLGKAPHIARPPEGKPVYVNPCDVKDEILNQRNLDAAAQSCLKFGYTLGVQIHKYANLE